ncbi:hypothetical protein M5E83_09650 [Bifidobacterium adolescentis]|uniref:hypothetical protein n=1 Tax=Bifidobacterium adolescentis TaxID=1680 RepID=UPI00201B909E|nr:hypothetical protein [Bifidobacterium adolescentis]UQT37200.1 hypothetical protein M5E83_09650 [Bifidobacterium adolescentis]
MKDSEADIAIGVLNKLIDQELEAVRAATRDGNTPFGSYAQTRHNAFLYARDEIRKALADLQTLSGSEDIQISHALTMATIQASKALKQAHLMQDTADMLDQADQRDEENKISRMLMHKIAQQGE